MDSEVWERGCLRPILESLRCSSSASCNRKDQDGGTSQGQSLPGATSQDVSNLEFCGLSISRYRAGQSVTDTAHVQGAKLRESSNPSPVRFNPSLSRAEPRQSDNIIQGVSAQIREEGIAKAGQGAAVKVREECIAKAGQGAAVKVREECIAKAGQGAAVKVREECIAKAGQGAAAKVREECIAKAGQGAAAQVREAGIAKAGQGATVQALRKVKVPQPMSRGQALLRQGLRWWSRLLTRSGHWNQVACPLWVPCLVMTLTLNP